MDSRRPQLSLDELLRLKWLLGGLLVLLSVSTVIYLDIDAWLLTGLTFAGVLTVLAKPAWPARLPAVVHRLAFPAIVAIFIGDLYLTTEVLPALVRLDILLLLYRGVTYRQRRDDLQVIVLGLFLIVLAGVLTVSLAFAVQILAFVACALVFLLVVTLVQAAEPAGSKAVGANVAGVVPAWTHGSWQALLRRVRAATDWRIALLGGGLFAGLVVVSGLLFLAIPRFELQNSLFLDRFITKKARTGFTDHIKFGDVTDIQQDNSVALSVDVTDPTRIPARPYWRMIVLDDYHDQSFRLSPVLRHAAFSREYTESFLRGSARAQLGPPVYWTFYLEAGVSRYLPLAGAFDLLRFRERQNFRVSRSLDVVALRNEPVSMTAYRVEGMQPDGRLPDPDFALKWQQARAEGTEGQLTQANLDLSQADRAQLAGVVQEITQGELLTVSDFARRAGAWLAQRHDYALQSRLPTGAGDPLVRWLVSRAPGHCELFAGALVLLAREAGMPARVVTGFRGGSWNGFSNNLTLRNSNAHAWCEIFDAASRTWLRADPTPGAQALVDDNQADALGGQARRVDRSWSARWDSLRIFWYRRIVNFDQRSQVETFKAVKSATQEVGRRLRDWLAGWGSQVKGWLKSPWNGRRMAGGAAVLAGLGLLWWWGRRWPTRWWRWRRPRRGRLHPVRTEAGRWLRQFEGRETDPGVRAALQRLRYGAESGWPRPEPVFRQARREWRRGRRGRSATVGKAKD